MKETAHGIGERGGALSLQALEQLLYDSDRQVRATAMDALSLRPTLDQQDVFVRALRNPDPRIRSLADELLAELRER
jgi:HEAT repeat protein